MVNNIKHISTILLVAIIWPLNGLSQTNDKDFKIVDPNEYADVLSMLASATQNNYGKIKTWEGQIENVISLTIRGERAKELSSKHINAESNSLPNEIQQIVNRTIEFKIDIENNRFFNWSKHKETPFYFDPNKNMTFPSSWKPEETELIVTSENQIKISPLVWRKKDDAILSRIAIKDYAGASQRIDPRELFYIGDKTLWLTLSQASQSLKIPNIEKIGIVIKKQTMGNNISYRIEASEPGKDRPFSIVILDSKAGFNCTYTENWYDNGSLMSETTAEFVKIQDVFLPKKWTVLQYFPDGGLMQQIDCLIENQQINTPIPDNTFSAYTYLHNGDKFKDNIAHKEYKYQDANLVFVSDLPAPATDKKKTTTAEPNK